MKRIFVLLTFLVLTLACLGHNANAQNERFLDIAGEITYGEECLQEWQIDVASSIASKLLLVAPENPYVCFFAGEVEFYEGNYKESLSFLKKAIKSPAFAQKGKSFYDFIEKVYQTTSKFKEIKTEHFRFRYVEEKDAILVDYALDTLEKTYKAIGNDLNYFPTPIVFAPSLRLPKTR